MRLKTTHKIELDAVITKITMDFIRSQSGVIPENSTFNRVLDDAVHESVISAMFKSFNGNQSKTAEYLGINRATLRSWSKRVGLL